METPVGTYCVDGYNMAAVIRKLSNEGTAGTYETICICKGDNWKENAALIAKLLEQNRKEQLGHSDPDKLANIAGELLEALIELEQMIHANELNEGTMSIVREAISKATGGIHE